MVFINRKEKTESAGVAPRQASRRCVPSSLKWDQSGVDDAKHDDSGSDGNFTGLFSHVRLGKILEKKNTCTQEAPSKKTNNRIIFRLFHIKGGRMGFLGFHFGGRLTVPGDAYQVWRGFNSARQHWRKFLWCLQFFALLLLRKR